MPYIEERFRRDGPSEFCMSTPGELNYAITKTITEYLACRELSYTAINDVLGALEGAKMEFYRRVVVPFEEKKRSLNGDVYPDELTRP